MRYLWYSMYGFVTALAVYALFFRPPAVVEENPPLTQTPVTDPREDSTVDVQIALILDTSSSMDGLVAQARTQLWEMVSDLQTGPDGDERKVAVALYQYGNNRLPKSDGFIQQLAPLTTDLDLVTVKLHALSTSGGKEYAPEAILRAADELEWSGDDAVERIIVIAGNEGFAQGKVTSHSALARAQDLKISVVTIFCTNRGATDGALASWREAAELAGTDFTSINSDLRVVQVSSPYDREIMQKCQALEENRVYGANYCKSEYTAQAERFVEGSSAIDRALVQSRQVADKDLVTAYGSGAVELEKVALPGAVANKSLQEKKAYLEEKAAVQANLRRELAELSAKRKNHIQQQRRARAGAPKVNLGDAVRSNVLKGY